MKFAMKHGGLCSMSFVLRICSCVVFLCTWVAFLCACEGNASKIVTQVLRKALTFYSLVLEQMQPLL